MWHSPASPTSQFSRFTPQAHSAAPAPSGFSFRSPPSSNRDTSRNCRSGCPLNSRGSAACPKSGFSEAGDDRKRVPHTCRAKRCQFHCAKDVKNSWPTASAVDTTLVRPVQKVVGSHGGDSPRTDAAKNSRTWSCDVLTEGLAWLCWLAQKGGRWSDETQHSLKQWSKARAKTELCSELSASSVGQACFFLWRFVGAIWRILHRWQQWEEQVGLLQFFSFFVNAASSCSKTKDKFLNVWQLSSKGKREASKRSGSTTSCLLCLVSCHTFEVVLDL